MFSQVSAKRSLTSMFNYAVENGILLKYVSRIVSILVKDDAGKKCEEFVGIIKSEISFAKNISKVSSLKRQSIGLIDSKLCIN